MHIYISFIIYIIKIVFSLYLCKRKYFQKLKAGEYINISYNPYILSYIFHRLQYLIKCKWHSRTRHFLHFHMVTSRNYFVINYDIHGEKCLRILYLKNIVSKEKFIKRFGVKSRTLEFAE